MLTKDEVLNQMTESPEGEESFYPLTDNIGIYITSIVYRNEKWYLNVWNNYHDFTAWEKELKEEEALEYLTYDINKNKKVPLDKDVIEAIETFKRLLNDIPLDEQNIEELRNKYPILINVIEKQIQKFNGKLFGINKLMSMQKRLLFEQQSQIDAVKGLLNTINIETRNGQVISIGISNPECEDDSVQDNLAKRILKTKQVLSDKNG